jgi:ornithine cyclodeaminase/alanine dehydrogenase
MDATWITAQRTGAATALAAKYLARPDSTIAGILACGAQGRSNLTALSRLFPLTHARAFDILPEAADRFVGEMGEMLGIEVEVVGSPEDAVRGCDLVVTSGPILENPAPTIQPGWLELGAFASLVDFDSYWTGAAMAKADKLATDDIEQMEYYRQLGYFRQTPRAYADLGEIVCGQKPGRESPDERILCVNLGIALDDMATAILVYEEAKKQGLGQTLVL